MPPGEYCEVVLDAGVIKNGYPRYEFNGGKGVKVSFAYYDRHIGPDGLVGRLQL